MNRYAASDEDQNNTLNQATGVRSLGLEYREALERDALSHPSSRASSPKTSLMLRSYGQHHCQTLYAVSIACHPSNNTKQHTNHVYGSTQLTRGLVVEPVTSVPVACHRSIVMWDEAIQCQCCDTLSPVGLLLRGSLFALYLGYT